MNSWFLLDSFHRTGLPKTHALISTFIILLKAFNELTIACMAALVAHLHFETLGKLLFCLASIANVFYVLVSQPVANADNHGNSLVNVS